MKVDVCITQGSPRDHVSANSDTQNWSSCGEFFEQHIFCNVWVEISNIERGHSWTYWRGHITFISCFNSLRAYHFKAEENEIVHYNVPLPSCRTNDSNIQIKTNGSFFNKVNWILGNIIQSMIQIIIYLNLKKVSIPY